MATILVVDENPVGRRIMRMTVEMDGHRVAEADSGAHALELLRTFAFDIVFLPMDMGQMDGAGLIAQTRAMSDRAATQFVAVLEQHDEKGPVESFMAGASDLLIRPFGAHEVRDIVERACAPDQIDLRDRLVGIQLDAYETATRLREQTRQP